MRRQAPPLIQGSRPLGVSRLRPVLARRPARCLLPSLSPKQIGHGEARVDYGDEEPKYPALERSINAYYRDLLRPLSALREACFMALPMSDPAKAEAEPFRYLAKHRAVIDDAISIFLAEVAGPDRSRKGFVEGGIESDNSDGVIQQRNIFSQSIGVARAGQVLGVPTSLTSERQSPSVKAMLNDAFTRLSENGRLRLENVRNDIHSLLTSAQAAGLSPLETARQLGKQFDEIKGYQWPRLARTESAYASIAGSREQYQELGVSFVVWLLAVGACPVCQQFEGLLIPIEETDRQPPGHVNCLCDMAPAGVEVE